MIDKKFKGALELEMPKMPKVEEFYHLKRDGSQQNHNFRHFRSFLILAHLLVSALFIGLELYQRTLDAFLRWVLIELRRSRRKSLAKMFGAAFITAIASEILSAGFYFRSRSRV
jgi:hypothetical protein